MISIRTTEIESAIDKLNSIIDYVCDLNHIYLLGKDHVVSIIDYSGNIKSIISLKNIDYTPSCINIDLSYLYIGYSNGTIEILDQNASFETIKITSSSDAGGPGAPIISNLMISGSYLFANTAENGVLIYLKPSILFHKWIMIELETSIISFSFGDNLLFVLVNDGIVHCLDFQIHRLDEIPIGGYAYVDLEFQNGLLYLVSKQLLHVYSVAENYKLIYSYKEMKGQILSISVNENLITILLTKGSLRIIQREISSKNKEFEILDPVQIDNGFSKQIFDKLKYADDRIRESKKLDELEFVYLKNDRLIKSEIKLG